MYGSHANALTYISFIMCNEIVISYKRGRSNLLDEMSIAIESLDILRK